MDGLLYPAHLDGLSAVTNWLTYAQATGRIIEENYGHVTDKASRLTATVEENVLVQIENLRTHPSVAAATSRGDLKLHGWTYELETGQVFSYDPKEGQFLPVEHATGIPKPPTYPCGQKSQPTPNDSRDGSVLRAQSYSNQISTFPSNLP